MPKKTVADILGDLTTPRERKRAPKCRPLTLWMPEDLVERYAQAQLKSGRRLSKAAKDVMEELITAAEEQLGGAAPAKAA